MNADVIMKCRLEQAWWLILLLRGLRASVEIDAKNEVQVLCPWQMSDELRWQIGELKGVIALQLVSERIMEESVPQQRGIRRRNG